MHRILWLFVAVFSSTLAIAAQPQGMLLTKSGEGVGPAIDGEVIHVLNGDEKEVNSLVLPAPSDGPVQWLEIRAGVRFNSGGEGFGLLVMNADIVGKEGSIQTVDQWEEPSRLDAIGIGFDSKNPESTDPFDANGNYYDRAQREVSVHVDGRELFNRVSKDFATGEYLPIIARLEYVIGGAELTVVVDGETVYDRQFIPSVKPMMPRVALGARAGAKVKLDVQNLEVKVGPAAKAQEPPVRMMLFAKSEIGLKTTREAFAVANFKDIPQNTGRVIATIRLENPPSGMDKWDRRGALYLYTEDRQQFEIVRFMTPFMREWEWQVDVTDFLPLFKEQPKLGLYIDTWRDSFLVSVDMDFYPGETARKPIAVMNLWKGEPIIGDTRRPVADFFDDKTIIAPPGATSAKVRVVASGHGQKPNTNGAGESIQLQRDLTVNEQKFSNLLWTTDNYLNPCRPQKGTWKADRAGWGPGRVTMPWSVDITPILSKSRELTLRYRFADDYVNEYVGSGAPPTHWIDSQVIFYADTPPTAPRSK
jgi:hypothetical protein